VVPEVLKGTAITRLTTATAAPLASHFSCWRRSPDERSNWLPAPDGPFSLYLRAYRPEQDILDGTWTPPLIRLG
jgi:Protein of unknown function (DUF1214)